MTLLASSPLVGLAALLIILAIVVVGFLVGLAILLITATGITYIVPWAWQRVFGPKMNEEESNPNQMSGCPRSFS